MDIKAKIEKLLAKAEGTDNDHERDAFTAQAERLMIKWGTESADLEARGEIKPEEIVEHRLVFNGTLAVCMPGFVSSVAAGMGNLRTLQSGTRNRWHSYVIGHKSDVEALVMLVDSLERQVTTARKRWWKTAPERQWLSGWEASKAQREFIWSFGNAVGGRLRRARTDLVADATPGAALVLVSKKERVDDDVSTRYPRLGKAREKSGSHYGSAEGYRAGQEASLGEKAIGDQIGAIG